MMVGIYLLAFTFLNWVLGILLYLFDLVGNSDLGKLHYLFDLVGKSGLGKVH